MYHKNSVEINGVYFRAGSLNDLESLFNDIDSGLPATKIAAKYELPYSRVLRIRKAYLGEPKVCKCVIWGVTFKKIPSRYVDGILLRDEEVEIIMYLTPQQLSARYNLSILTCKKIQAAIPTPV